MNENHTEKRRTLVGEIRELTGLNTAKCYQCAKCSAGCPMTAEMSLKPHDMMRLILNDDRERLFADESIWLCLTCETCTARCPNECDPARIIDGVRELVLRRDQNEIPKAILAFHEAFLGQIRASGRLSELGLMIKYKLSGGPLFQDVFEAPGMLTRGKLSFRRHKIKGIKEIRRIFAACEAPRKEET